MAVTCGPGGIGWVGGSHVWTRWVCGPPGPHVTCGPGGIGWVGGSHGGIAWVGGSHVVQGSHMLDHGV